MGYKWWEWLKAQPRTVTPAGDSGGKWSQSQGNCPLSSHKLLMERGNTSHHLTRGWRATAKCKQGYSSKVKQGYSSWTSLCLPAETQQLVQHPKGHWKAPAFSRTGHACCRLMFSTKSLTRCVLETIQGTYTGDQVLSPISCVLSGGQAMKYKHIVTKESHWTDTRDESLLARRKESPRLLWDAVMDLCVPGPRAPSLLCWYAVTPSWSGSVGSSTSW